MDMRVNRITQELKKHDRTLKAIRTNTGMIQVWRTAESWRAADLIDGESDSSQPMQFITALTDNWNVTGIPIDLGIDPLMWKIQEMDSWSKESMLDEMRRGRERAKEDRQRVRKNENRAIAYDLRKEFANATNEINTSTLEKIDKRRDYGITKCG